MLRFYCPGCHQTHPIEEGQLVTEHTKYRAARKASNYVRGYPAQSERTIAAFLCGPCTADVVLARAGVSR